MQNQARPAPQHEIKVAMQNKSVPAPWKDGTLAASRPGP